MQGDESIDTGNTRRKQTTRTTAVSVSSSETSLTGTSVTSPTEPCFPTDTPPRKKHPEHAGGKSSPGIHAARNTVYAIVASVDGGTYTTR